MKIKLEISGFFIDDSREKIFEINDDRDAVQLPNGETLKVKQLKGEALEQYVYEKYIEGGPYDGRINNIEFVQ